MGEAMITVALMGGLGNQIFQWALGKAFEHRGHDVQYDTALFDGDPGRRYMLDQLGLDLKLSHHGGTGQIMQEGSMRYKPGLLDSLTWPNISKDASADATLIGYWQCEKYFEDIPQTIRSFSCANLSRQSWDMQEAIRSYGDRSCFVHVRRSDNLRPAGLTVHGLICEAGKTYYQRTMNCMRDRFGSSIHFFMFSDDPQWCRDNFNLPDVTVVGHNAPSFTVDDRHEIHFKAGGREVEDLWLMRLCRHAIIANSSFSWWGAWLGDTARDRIVLAPEPWFNSRDLDSTDIIPERWMKIAIR